jgi:hypothetical protein
MDMFSFTRFCLRVFADLKEIIRRMPPIELIKRHGPYASFYRTLGEVVGLDAIAIPSATIQTWEFKTMT